MAHHQPALLHDPRRKTRRGKLIPVGLFVLLLAFLAVQVRHGVPAAWYDMLTLGRRSLDQDKSERNAKQKKGGQNLEKGKKKKGPKEAVIPVSVRRTDFEKACNQVDNSNDLEALRQGLQENLYAIFTPPSVLPKLKAKKNSVKPCMYTFIDLGANVGDSLGKFIDAGFPASCPALEKIERRVHYGLDDGIIKLGDGNMTDLTDTIRTRLSEVSRTPEQYCYVGVEGNPVFTSRLKAMEARVAGTTPKPVKAAHFYTETVAAGKNGPTVLYLDTVNKGKNFWGSSVVRTHADVQKSAAKNGNSVVEAKVNGVTLSSLLQRAVKREKGAHVLVKIDIEGGEYPVMNEAIGTLCDLSNAGVRVDLILELHWEGVLGRQNADYKTFHSKTNKQIEACNIHRGRLRAASGE